jgi:YD repeat-containing protein
VRPDDFVTRWAYDPLNQRLRETTGTTVVLFTCDPLPNDGRTASFAYDALGMMRASTDFGGLVTASVYDRAGRTTRTL